MDHLPWPDSLHTHRLGILDGIRYEPPLSRAARAQLRLRRIWHVIRHGGTA